MSAKKYLRALSLAMTFLLLPCAIAPLGAVAAAPTVTLPSSLTADSSCATYDSSGASKLYYYTGVQKSDYDSYISTLKSGGYTELKTYASDDCYYSLLDNGTATLFVSYLRSVSNVGSAKGRLRVFVQASGTPYHTQSTAKTSDVCTPMLWQLDVDNSGGQDGGMSYVIRLTDGSFAVIDGGYETDREAANLYSILAQNNPLEGKPIISAWFITHLHSDHYGVLYRFTRLYSDDVTVKGFYYNFPSATVGDVSEINGTRLETAMRKWTGAVLYSKLHSGMVMGFAGATVEVLATHEDIMQSYYSGTLKSLTQNSFGDDGNETSTVLRFNIAGQSIIFLADAEKNTSKALLGTHTSSYLSSDIMQMAHHGFDDTVSSDLINAIDPSVVLWPMDIIRYKDGVITVGTTTDTKTFICYYNKDKAHVNAVKSAASEVIPAYKNEALALPYTANTLYSTTTPDVAALATAKEKLIKATKDIYVQYSTDKSRLRFIGVLDITETELESYSSFGFDVSMLYGGNKYQNSYTTTTVYSSIIADGETVYANQYGGTYFYVVEVRDLGAADTRIEFIVNGTGTYKSGTNEYKLSYSVGRSVVLPTLKGADSGTLKSFSLSDIVSGADSSWRESQ